MHARAVDEQRHVVGRTFHALHVVVLRNRAADDDARVPGQVREQRVEDVAPDVVEVHMDPVWAVLPQRGLHVLVLVVDGGVEAELVDDVCAFLRTAGDAHGAAPLDARDLAHHLADRARSRRNDDGLAGLGLADFEQAEIGGHARHAEDAERG